MSLPGDLRQLSISTVQGKTKGKNLDILGCSAILFGTEVYHLGKTYRLHLIFANMQKNVTENVPVRDSDTT